MSDCEIYIAKARKGRDFQEQLRWKRNNESYDLSSAVGKAYLFDDGEKVAEYDLNCYFTDISSPNFNFDITTAELALLKDKVYDVLFVIDNKEIPENESYKLNICLLYKSPSPRD